MQKINNFKFNNIKLKREKKDYLQSKLRCVANDNRTIDILTMSREESESGHATVFRQTLFLDGAVALTGSILGLGGTT